MYSLRGFSGMRGARLQWGWGTTRGVSPVTQTQRRPLAQELDLPGLTEELRRSADEVDRTRRVPVEGMAALAARGLWGALIPTQDGGLGLTPAQLFEVSQAVGAGCAATGLMWGQHLAATAMIAKWGTPTTRPLLPSAARGGRLFGIGVGHSGKPGSPVGVRHVGGRVLMSGTAPWVTNATVMRDALIAAVDPEQGGVVLAVVSAADVTPGEPYGLLAVTAAQTATVAFEDVDVTDTLLDAPRDRAAHGAVFTQNKSPRDAGFYSGLARAALGLCRRIPNLDAPAGEQLGRVEAAAASAGESMRAWLEPRVYEDIDAPPFWTLYHRAAEVMQQAAGLMMSAGGSGGLRDGSTQSRIGREAMYYLARIPFRAWVVETARALDGPAVNMT